MRIPPVDLAIAAGLALSGEVEIWAPRLMVGTGAVHGSRPILGASTLVMAAALAARRTSPVASVTLVAAAVAVQGLLTEPTGGLTVLVILAVAAASIGGTRYRGAGLALLLAAIVPGSTDAADWTFGALVVGAAWSAGVVLARRVQALEVAESERAAAAANERARIARELHDIVAHRVTTIVVRAQATQLITNDEEVCASLDTIEATARAALAELRDLLGVLRTDDHDGRLPQPGLTDVPRLVEDTSAAGVPVEIRVLGEPYEVEAGLGLAAYRIVQEALTNIAKHARPTRAEVVLRFEPSALAVEVADEGAVARSPGRGNGLIGMRERVAVYGGTLEAGAREGGGFVVRATLPVRSAP